MAALLALPSISEAITRTWVSSTGNDANACTRSSPCATFSGALSKTTAGGEINCVDAGHYGQVIIDKAVTIDCAGTFGSLIAPNAAMGIQILAGATDVVIIRNLSIRGEPGASGNEGIRYTSGKALHVENVTISGTAGACIEVGADSATLLTVDNATLTDCGSGVGAFTSSTTAGNTQVVNINNTRILNTVNGVAADNGSRVAIRDSTIYFNSRGVLQSNIFGTALGSTVTVVNSTFGYSSVEALRSVSGDFILAFGNTFVNDVLALSPSGGMIFTGVDNINSGSTQGTANGGSLPRF